MWKRLGFLNSKHGANEVYCDFCKCRLAWDGGDGINFIFQNRYAQQLGREKIKEINNEKHMYLKQPHHFCGDHCKEEYNVLTK